MSEVVDEGKGEYVDFHIPDVNFAQFIPAGGGKHTGLARWGVYVTRQVKNVTYFSYHVSKATAEDFSFVGWAFVPPMVVP